MAANVPCEAPCIGLHDRASPRRQWNTVMFPHLSKFNLQQWIDADKEQWGRRRTVWQDSDFITVVHRGPNRGKQFHINEGDEIFYQLEGELSFHYINS